MELADFIADGKLAVAWGIGASMGYAFALKTVLKIANSRIDELKEQLDKALIRIDALQDQRFDLAREKP